MSAAIPEPDNDLKTAERQGVRLVTLVCLLSAIAMALPLLARGLGSGALIVALVGMVLPLLRVRFGPIVLLMVFLWIVLADRLGMTPLNLLVNFVTSILSLFFLIKPRWMTTMNPLASLGRTQPILDILLCASVIAYIASYYRLLSVTRNLFPLDRRRRAPSPGNKRDGSPTLGPILEPKRSPALIQPSEFGRLVLAVLAIAVAAQLTMIWVRGRVAWRDLAPLSRWQLQDRIPDTVWQLLVLLWLFAFLLLVVNAIVSYLGHRKMSLEEAALYLQDELWRQTRREQARLNRWLAWAEKKEAKRRSRQHRRESMMKQENRP